MNKTGATNKRPGTLNNSIPKRSTPESAFHSGTRVSVHRLNLTGIHATMDDLVELLGDKCVSTTNTGTKPKRKNKYDSYKRIRKFRYFQDREIHVLYRRYKTTDLPQSVRINIYNPSTSLMNFLYRVLTELGTGARIKKIEIAWDFYVDNVLLFKEWVEKHLWLYHNHQSYTYYRDDYSTEDIQRTYYISNLYKTVKGVRVYLRPKDSYPKEYVRMELELHRPLIHKLNIKFPLTVDQLPKEFTKIMRLCEVDFDKLTESYLWKNGVGKSMKHSEPYNTGRGYRLGILRQTIGCDIDDIKWSGRNLLQQMDMVKGLGLTNPIRFLKPMVHLDWLFNELPHNQGFNL